MSGSDYTPQPMDASHVRLPREIEESTEAASQPDSV